MASTVRYAAAPPPTAHALSRPHVGADAVVPDDSSDSESVAESTCPGPYSRRSTAGGFLGGDYDEDDDGCSSCVEVGGLGCYEEAENDDEEVSTASVWWKKRLSAAGDDCVFPPAEAREEVEDPERTAARQAEDRKFWEDCLGTGYP